MSTVATVPSKPQSTVTLEGVEIRFRNFEGKEAKFNPAGKRNFVVWLDPATARDLTNAGWPVKHLQPREEGEDPQAILKVNVKYSANGNRPPQIVLISRVGGNLVRTSLTEDMIQLLDWVDIANVDMIIRPYNYDFNGREGTTAYLNSIYVTIRQDELEQKYSEVPELETGRGMSSAQLAITDGGTVVAEGSEYEDLGEYED